jgi:hypothetical protein
MAKGKETIKPPTKSELQKAAPSLARGNSLAGRIMAEKSVYVRQNGGKRRS